MHIIQTYSQLRSYGLNFCGGYLSPLVNWLSIALSGLLLKEYNPQIPLCMYTNFELKHIFKDLFLLPYDTYFILDDIKNEYRDFYCYPKIQTYSMQNAPFLHIDCDVFCKEALKKRLLTADLVAQHEENDSNFYMLVLNHLKSCNAIIPDYMRVCFGENNIHSYNAGVLGGNNVFFWKEYVEYVKYFLSSNANSIRKSDKKFLYNVVFEQWIFYALAHTKRIKVETFIKGVVKDFVMPWGTVPDQVVEANNHPYIHIMNYKSHPRCNSYIIRQMYRKYPEYFDRILYVCHKNDICQKITLKGIANSEYEKRAIEYEKISNGDLLNSIISISPDVKFISNKKVLTLHDKKECKQEGYLKTYNTYLAQNVYIKYDSVMTNLLKIFRKPIRLNEIITDLDPFQQEYLITSIRKGLFDNVLII